MNSPPTIQEHGNIASSEAYFLKFGLLKHLKILDVGCYYGSLINRLYLQGYEDVYGIDIRETPVKEGKALYPKLKERISLYDGDVLPYEANVFDVVLMFDVIEHIPDVQDFLREQVYRVLKTGGTFIFQTPNKITNIPWEIINHRSFTAYKKFHCSLQTRGSLEKLLKTSGFHEIAIEKFNILTEYNKARLGQKIGPLATPLLHALQALPLTLSTNFWGSCRK